MKLSISVYCVLLYYQKVLNNNVQKKILLNARLGHICRMPNCLFAGRGANGSQIGQLKV